MVEPTLTPRRWQRILPLVLLLLPLAAAAQQGTAPVADGDIAPTEGQATTATPEAPGMPAGGTTDSATAPRPAPRPRSIGAREASLAAVLAARRQIEADLRERQTLLQSDAARGRERVIEDEIQILSNELEELSRNFSELAAGVDPASIESDDGGEDLNLAREVRDLLGPLVNELKRATSRPREIDRLRTEISELQEQLGQVRGALARLERIRASVSNAQVIEAIDEEERDWKRRQSALTTTLQVAQQKLDQRLSESQSITQAVENLFQLFFKSRGRNLLLALFATIAFLLGFRRLRAFLSNQPVVSERSSSFEGRVFSLVYSVFTVIGAILVFLIALYFFGDWVLLILVLLLILGLIWTSKQAIPRFWSQAVLILDMGVVREGERVIYDGLPWRVDSISFYSMLSNPELVGGLIRLPIDDLGELRSRPFGEDEAWFPTRPGDVVLLPDGRAGRIEFQSVDFVRLRSPGGNLTSLPTREFAGQSIERLNDGYRVSITFGLDYGDQAEITTTMRETLQRGIETRWRATRWADSMRGVSVEFQEAGASSLDYFVRADLDGSQAFDIQAQTRALAGFCVDVCNEQGWVIPFTQLTLHVAPTQESSE